MIFKIIDPSAPSVYINFIFFVLIKLIVHFQTQPIAAEKANIFNQPLILTKNKKMSKPVAKAIITQAITASTEIPVGKEEKVTSPTTSLSPEDIRKVKIMEKIKN